MSLVTGTGGAGVSDADICAEGDDNTDQDGGLHQVQVSSSDNPDITTAVPISTIATTVDTAPTYTTATTAPSATVGGGVGKGRGKGKGPAPKRTALVPSYTTTSAKRFAPSSSTAPTLAEGTALVRTISSPTLVEFAAEPVAVVPFDALSYCGFVIYFQDLLTLYAIEGDFLRTVNERARSSFSTSIRECFSVHGVPEAGKKEERISSLHNELLNSSLETARTLLENVYLTRILHRAVASTHIREGERRKFNEAEVAEFMKSFSANVMIKVRDHLSYEWNNEILKASTVDSSSVRGDVCSSESATTHDEDYCCAPFSTECVDMFGFLVLPETYEMVSTMVREVRVMTRRVFGALISQQLSANITKLSAIQGYTWCLTYKPFFESGVIHRCLAGYYSRHRDSFVAALSSVRVLLDSSSRRLVPLIGSRLRDFLVATDGAVKDAIQQAFTLEWEGSTRSVFSEVDLQVESSSIALSGIDFISAHETVGVPTLVISAPTTSGMSGRTSRSKTTDSAKALEGSSASQSVRRKQAKSVRRRQAKLATDQSESSLLEEGQVVVNTRVADVVSSSHVSGVLEEAVFVERPPTVGLGVSSEVVESVSSVVVQGGSDGESSPLSPLLCELGIVVLEEPSEELSTEEVDLLTAEGVSTEVVVSAGPVPVSGSSGDEAPLSVHSFSSEEGELIIDVSAKSPDSAKSSELAGEEEVELSTIGTASPRIVVLATSASSVTTSAKVEESPTIPISSSISGLIGPKKLFMNRYSNSSSAGGPSS
ncbi:hypothetical protein [Candidatus Ichthyocystis hellenicum]|uniref:hypothetical protein n=1 Tax=Candidatus Ichthyocystis hellenicum TaxID=1561003 RepID=UPI000B84BD2C|nr:hypothetical protein [Candidatus Ichthyocystis hellenicum]